MTKSIQNNENIQTYLSLLAENPSLNAGNEMLQILLDEEQMLAWEEENQMKLGIVVQDRFVTFIRDLVRFPSGGLTGYNRLINTAALQNGGAGSVVLPVMDEKVLLMRMFRHPTQRQSIEIPRGFGEPGLTPLEIAEKEVSEEVGGKIKKAVELGIYHNNTGLEGNDVYLYLAEMESVGETSPEEGIENLFWVTVSELEQMIADEKITDGFTIAAYTRAKLKGLL